MFKRYWFMLIVLAILSPIGLIAEGTAWGEWDATELHARLGMVPKGIEQYKDLWQSIFPDYSMHFLGESPIGHSIEYILSAVIGSVLIYAVAMLMTRLIIQQKNKQMCQNK